MRLQLNLRNNCLARGINLKEEIQTPFLKVSNNPDKTPRGAICHLCLPLRAALLLRTRLRLLLSQGEGFVLHLPLVPKPGITADGTLKILT